MTDKQRDMITVGVAHATLAKQLWIKIRLPVGATLMDANDESGILKEFTDIDLDAQKVGVFGREAKLDTVLNHGDRVEIYRPITADPKKVKRKKVERKKKD